MVESEVMRLDSIFHALSDSTRRAILRRVAEEGKTVGEIAEPFFISLAAVSKHLQVLEKAELIERERKGSCRVVRLKAVNLRPAEEWLAFYEQFWTRRLDALQTYLEEEDCDDRGQ